MVTIIIYLVTEKEKKDKGTASQSLARERITQGYLIMPSASSANFV